ncbi:Serine/threonine-protein kinase SSN3 [Madurella mycetomatis]|uniref:Serine/threonine-protein kinase SSN3 n=1 Tax=Madurella mycetomatis TaxID=100816 RepID=A0A175VY77_9PEZI|nr:Serine/threonine-protein kinase SSN3 [Madurella mycetomatis]
MSLTNPPSSATGPGSVSAVRTQALKRSVQAAFEAAVGASMENWPAPPSPTQRHQQTAAGRRATKPYGRDLPWASLAPGLMQHYGSVAPFYPFSGGFGTSPSLAMIPTKRPRTEVSFQPRPYPADRGIGPMGYQSKVRVTDKYKVVGFISSGTYGRVYKALGRHGQAGEFAIKKFKPDKEGEQVTYTGISQSAVREMALCSELNHANVIRLIEIILEDKCIFMVFEYAEHDLLQIIHHHTQQPRHPIPPTTIKSIMFQLLNGCQYLHTNWVLHRDLKPANIMVTSAGEVKIGDLGLARLSYKPLHSLFSGDKVVVTIWYRAPELLLGSRHYTPAIDMWAVGCIFAELLSLRPIFKGEEAKMDSKKTVPFQRNQMQKIVDIMGLPTKERWPLLTSMHEYSQLGTLQPPINHSHHHHHHHSHHYQRQAGGGNHLEKWYYNTINLHTPGSSTSGGNPSPLASLGSEGYKLLAGLLEYDPEKRLTAAAALQHPFFSTGDAVSANCFEGLKMEYPHRRVSQDDNDIRTSSLPGTKRSGLPDDSLVRPGKRVKEG